jgi:hypothetical protein
MSTPVKYWLSEGFPDNVMTLWLSKAEQFDCIKDTKGNERTWRPNRYFRFYLFKEKL